MGISLILKIAGTGLLVSIAYIILNKAGRDEMAMMVSLGGIVIVVVMLLTELSELIDRIRGMFGI